MRFAAIICLILVLVAAAPSLAVEKKAFKMRDDFGAEPLQQCFLQYYYYIPCPTYSWFWGFYGWSCGDIVGEFFVIGDTPTGGYTACDAEQCHTISGVRVLDFAGYGTVYPGLYTVEFDIYCADESGCPLGPSLWNSGPVETEYSWNIVELDTLVGVTPCVIDPGPPPVSPRVLVTATHTGTVCSYPQWGLDNISEAYLQPCEMHDSGCLPALFPRPHTSHYSTIHSGYYGVDFAYCPPLWFADANDSTEDGTVYGFLELAWRLFIECRGPDNATRAATWGTIKSLYK
jgi:hypothetical protein